MTEYKSPVPTVADAPPPEIYRQFYPMPMFTVNPTGDLDAARDFWVEGLGFIDLFTIPGNITHLRRWAFQDVLLVPGTPPTQPPPSASTSRACPARSKRFVSAANN